MSAPQISEVVINPLGDITPEQSELSHEPESISESRFKRGYNVAKRAVQSSVIALELAPTNEAIRFGAYAAALTQTRNPIVGAAVLGGTTLLVEGAAALATASVLETKQSNKSVDWLNGKINKFAPNGIRMSPPTEAGVAMVGGSAVVLALKQVENPERKLNQNRKHGMFTAGWMSAYFAAEGALVAEGIDDFSDPKKVGAVLLALGGLTAVSRKAKKQFKRASSLGKAERLNEAPLIHYEDTISQYREIEIVKNPVLTKTDIDESIAFNDLHRDLNDEAVKIGLYGDDVKNALLNPESVLVRYSNEDSEELYAPLLVPVESLEWYNIDLLKEKYGENTKFYYYASPPIPKNEVITDKLQSTIGSYLQNGAVVIYDYYPAQGSFMEELKQIDVYKSENLGRGLASGEAAVFAGVLEFGENNIVKYGPNLDEVYQKGVTTGEFIYDASNGIVLETVIKDDEAEKIWGMYSKPFEKLSKDDPMYAGFDKDTLVSMLEDSSVSKIVNRVDGDVTTLCFVTNNLKTSPWFNAEYFKKKYNQYYETDNVFIIPSIVTDETIKGKTYSVKLIDFIVQLAKKRETNSLVTFECSPISKRYIPLIVRRAISRSDRGSTSGFKTPISSMGYKAIRKGL